MRQNYKKEIYNEVVGISLGEVIICNYIFKNNPTYNGATGSILLPVTQEQIDYRNDPEVIAEQYDYLWREAVANNRTTESLEDFIQELLDDLQYSDEYYVGHDYSDCWIAEGCNKTKNYFPDAVTFECTGCGRIFSSGDIEFDEVFNQELLDKIIKAESTE